MMFPTRGKLGCSFKTSEICICTICLCDFGTLKRESNHGFLEAIVTFRNLNLEIHLT